MLGDKLTNLNIIVGHGLKKKKNKKELLPSTQGQLLAGQVIGSQVSLGSQFARGLKDDIRRYTMLSICYQYAQKQKIASEIPGPVFKVVPPRSLDLAKPTHGPNDIICAGS